MPSNSAAKQFYLLVLAGAVLQSMLETQPLATSWQNLVAFSMRLLIWALLWGLQQALLKAVSAPALRLGGQVLSMLFAVALAASGGHYLADSPVALGILTAAIAIGCGFFIKLHQSKLASALMAVSAICMLAAAVLAGTLAAWLLLDAGTALFAIGLAVCSLTLPRSPSGIVVMLGGLLFLKLAFSAHQPVQVLAAIAIGLLFGSYLLTSFALRAAANHPRGIGAILNTLLVWGFLVAGMFGTTARHYQPWHFLWLWVGVACFYAALFTLLLVYCPPKVDAGKKRWFYLGFTLLILAFYLTVTNRLPLLAMIGVCLFALAATVYLWQFMLHPVSMPE